MYNLPVIQYVPLRFKLIALEETQLPAFKGSLLRGAFGNALRRTVCVMGAKQLCLECFLNRQCVNTQIFETLILEEPPRFLRGLNTSPKPFILDVPDTKSKYSPGETFEFDMRLLGKAMAHFPFIIFSVQQMAERGLGSRLNKFRLDKTTFQLPEGHWKALYDGDSKKLVNQIEPSSTRRDHPQNHLPNTLTLQFTSPTRLKFDRELSKEFTFRKLLFKMLRRHLELAHFYGDREKINWEFHDLLVAANDVEITQNNLYWKEQNRYSARQKAEMYYGGFMGEITLQGNMTPFQDILRASEILHVGKGTTFGLGRIKIAIPPRDKSRG